GRAGNRGITKARVHYLISKNNSLFQAHPSIAGVYKLRYCLLFHWLIDKLKWKTLGHYSEQQSPTDGRVNQLGLFMVNAIFIDGSFVHSNFYTRLQICFLGPVRPG